VAESQNDSGPKRLPTVALACHALNVSSVAYCSNACVLACVLTDLSNFSGMRVLISTTAPIELPA